MTRNDLLSMLIFLVLGPVLGGVLVLGWYGFLDMLAGNFIPIEEMVVAAIAVGPIFLFFCYLLGLLPAAIAGGLSLFARRLVASVPLRLVLAPAFGAGAALLVSVLIAGIDLTSIGVANLRGLQAVILSVSALAALICAALGERFAARR
ncbi:hypothetical protein EMQ25_15490 [Arsenicitalea aurantiaca]|uniref:Uncharacterized protein n=1 Tax=Arsenicitalea aurantiaca TaxID=1783274 RepID=A0A433X3Z7_9HYPH|nr:hypothetical protein [Arsenicitalea aurantiaca]RUT28790.1 hypothetical protein EMQ25_15490 [Arsenicitalea aurantiaca]